MKILPALLSLRSILTRKRTAEFVLAAAALLIVSAALGQVGSLDTSFNPGSGANGKVSVVAVQKDGRILIGGEFTSVAGVSRSYLARLNSDGSVDETFGPVSTFAPITSLAIQEDGKILVNNAQPLVRIGGLIRLNADGSRDTTFGNQGGIANVWAFALQCDGKIIVGDNGLRRLNADGSLDLDFSASHGIFYFFGLFSQPDGKVIAAGATSLDGFPGFVRFASYRFNPDGSADDTFNRNTFATSFESQPDGKIVFGGLLWDSFGRLNLDGSLDTNFSAVVRPNAVASFAVQTDGKIVVGGYFLSLGQFPRQHIGRLFSDGTVDVSFAANTSINGDVLSVAIDNSGRVLIGGQFSTVDGESRNGIARLLANDSTAFGPCRTPQSTNQSPTIVSEPTSTEVAELSTASFDVGSGGTVPFSYQWYFNGQPILGATRSIITIPQVHFADAGRYSVIVSNSFGSVTSREATLALGYRLEVASRGKGGVQIDPVRRVYLPGTIVELNAAGENGRQLSEWLGDASGFNNPLTVVMDTNKKITAQFEYIPGDEKWRLQAFAGVVTTPAVGADGTLYFGGDRLYAVDGATGMQKWAFGPSLSSLVSSSPAIGPDGTIYFGSQDKKVYALDGVTGAKKWEFLTGDMVYSSPALGKDGTVFVGGNDKKVYALDGVTGAKKWEYRTRGAVASSPAVGVDGTVYVGSEDFTVYALDGATGAKKWGFLTGLTVHSSPAIGADGTIYIGSGDRKVYALDGATGTKKWEFAVGGDVVFGSPILGPDETLYVAADKVYAIHSRTGARKWDTLIPGYASPTLAADGTLYVANGSVYALDAATGTQKWGSVEAVGWIQSGVALGADGTIYFGAQDGYGKVYALQGTSGLAQSPWPKFRGDNQNTGRVKITLGMPQLQNFMMSGRTFQFSLPTQFGGNYRVEFKNLLTEPAWVPLADVIKGDGTVKVVTDPATDGSQRYYRIRVE